MFLWNDTSTNVSSGKPGYVGLYLYKEATLDEDGNLVNNYTLKVFKVIFQNK